MERRIRTYKAKDADYDWAKKRANTIGTPLATLVEKFLQSLHRNGFTVINNDRIIITVELNGKPDNYTERPKGNKVSNLTSIQKKKK